MKNNRILKLAFVCLIVAAVLSLAPQGGPRPASALDCPYQYTTGGGWTCTFAYVVCDGVECCCWYTPSVNDGRQCPSYCY